MAQVKIYGLRSTLERVRSELSNAIHNSVTIALQYPAEKRFHRFILLEQNDFVYPADRSNEYIILEISIFEGRSAETKKNLIQQLFENIHLSTGIALNDIEITIFETPKSHWGIRGKPADELLLPPTSGRF